MFPFTRASTWTVYTRYHMQAMTQAEYEYPTPVWHNMLNQTRITLGYDLPLMGGNTNFNAANAIWIVVGFGAMYRILTLLALAVACNPPTKWARRCSSEV